MGCKVQSAWTSSRARRLESLAILSLLPLAACGPGLAVPSSQSSVGAGSLVAPSLRQEPIEETSPVDDPPPAVWVANHAVATIWTGPDADAAPAGRIPLGSYFRLIGPGADGRLPVSFSGNGSISEDAYWIEAAAVGPIPEPLADWTQPDWPARRLIVGQRGELVRGDPSIPMVALTFDAGAGSGAIHELLDVLRDRRVPATFFIAGAFADRYPAIVARIATEGHELANHSYSHPDFRKLSDADMRSEIRLGTASIEHASGVRIAPLWRPPFGGRDDRVLRVVQEEGFRSIYWTFDSGDWLANATTERVRTTVLREASAGAVVVHHVSPEATARAMPAVIDELRRRGLELVTVGDLIGP